MSFDTPQVTMTAHHTKRVYHTRDCHRIRSDTRPATDVDLATLRECRACTRSQERPETLTTTCPFCNASVGELPAHLPCEEQP